MPSFRYGIAKYRSMASILMNDSPSIPAYASYRTFRNFIGTLGSVVPGRIDRSLMASMSGAAQSQLIHALRYLKLISQNGKPGAELASLAGEVDDTWREVLHGVLKTGYAFLWRHGFDVETATSHQLQEQFESAGASGETVQRCVRFFVAAAKDAQLPLSPHISGARFRRGRRKSVARKEVGTAKVAVPESVGHLQQEQHSKMIRLKNGGSIKLVADFNPFDLTDEEQELLQGLNGQVAKFEKNQSKETQEPVIDSVVPSPR